MVSVTIYVEGGVVNAAGDASVQTVDNSGVFREGFHRLFSQELSEEDFELVVQPIGSVYNAKKHLKKIVDEGMNGVILIDLDGPRANRADRLQTYAPLDTSRLFFMIQEMESWILSQPEKLDEYGKKEGLTRKRPQEQIGDDGLIRGLHPEAIAHPSSKLNTILRKYFSIEKVRKGKKKSSPKTYSKTKDGPQLIGLLELNALKQVFDEVQRLIVFIKPLDQ
jgi:hypothetical protein